MQKVRVLVLDVIDNKGLYETEIEHFDDYYKHLKCDCFDIATRKVGDKFFDMFVDDVGLFVDNPIPSAIDIDTMEVLLVGNIIFANHDGYGNTTSLTDDDINIIKENIIGLAEVDLGAVKSHSVVLAKYE